MSGQPGFDTQAAHRYFSAACFNQAWDLIDKAERTPDEDEDMLRLSLTSTWHWTQRSDCAPSNLSVGYWQTSRIYAILGQADNARRYGELSLGECQHEGVLPFYLGYAYEALARAEMVAKNDGKMQEYLALAHNAMERITEDEEAKGMLLEDLKTIG
jgi:hypothetical protein